MSNITALVINSNSNSRRPLPTTSILANTNKRTKKPSDELAEKQASFASNKFVELKKEIEPVEIKNLAFALMSDEDRQAMAVVTISDSKKTKDPQAINSSDMGSTTRTSICPTCKLRYPECNGHYGLINLPTPIFNPLYKKMMINIMSVVCHHCGEIKVPPESIANYGILKLPPNKRIAALVELGGEKDTTTCPNPHCYKISSSVKKNDLTPNKILRDGDSPLTIEQVSSLLDKRRFTTEKAAILGFTEGAHPSHIIMKTLLVLPEQLRRDFQIDGNTKHSDLTNAYSSIVNECNSYITLKKNGSSNEVLQSKTDRISKAIYDLFIQPEANNGKELKAISSNLSGKESVLRPGVRTDLNSRAVLNPGPQLKFGQIAIPTEHAKALLRKEKITSYNINLARRLIAQGKVVYVIKNNSTNKLDIKDENRMAHSRDIKIGDTIFRHTMEGDIVIMNRQPTIDKGSLQSYTVTIWNKRTIGIFLPSTTAHNIDFDGDEGNVYGTISLESMAEMMEIINSTSNIISTQSGKPSVGLVMNALSGGYALTAKGVIVSKSEIQSAFTSVLPDFTFKSFYERALTRGAKMFYSNTNVTYESATDIEEYDGNDLSITIHEGQHIVLNTGDLVKIPVSGNVYKVRKNGTYTLSKNGTLLIKSSNSTIPVSDDNISLGTPDLFDSKLYFSVALPASFQYRRGNVLIQDGIMLSGQLTKEHIGGSSGSIIHVIYSDYGRDVCAKFVSDATHILDEYARKAGISVGVYDYCPTLGSEKKTDELEHERYKQLTELNTKISDLPDASKCNIEMKKRIENKVVEYLEQATNNIGIKILKDFINEDSGLTIMANSGAKGSSINIAHTTGIIGPQYERGHRIQYAISSGTRTTPYFIPNDTDVKARGFIFGNYGKGVTPADAAHASVPTRTAIVNTAVDVSTAGYLARKLSRFSADIVASYLGSVVNSAETPGSKKEGISRIISLVYGDDGFDVSKLEMVRTPIGNVFLPVNIERVVSKINAEHGIFDKVVHDSQYTGPIEYED